MLHILVNHSGSMIRTRDRTFEWTEMIRIATVQPRSAHGSARKYAGTADAPVEDYL